MLDLIVNQCRLGVVQCVLSTPTPTKDADDPCVHDRMLVWFVSGFQLVTSLSALSPERSRHDQIMRTYQAACENEVRTMVFTYWVSSPSQFRLT
jgi:hypothetical protein